jgi:hypothetical protein
VLDDGCQREDGEELRGQERLLAAPAQRGADDALAPAEPVDLGRVDQRHAEVERTPDDPPGLRTGVLAAVPPLTGAELPGAKADLRDRWQALDLGEAHLFPGRGLELA